MLSRRSFIRSAAAACAMLGPAGNWAVAAGEETDDWSFPLLGDLHFDRLEHHDHGWLAREHPGDVSQVQNYSRITREMTPRLFARVSESLNELQRARVDLVRGRIASASSFGVGAAQLLQAARKLEPLDVDLARETYLEAWGNALAAGELASAGETHPHFAIRNDGSRFAQPILQTASGPSRFSSRHFQ